MESEALLKETVDGICTLTLNRPGALNSITKELSEMLQKELITVSKDSSVKVVIITGAGKAFCAGQDLSELTKPGAENDLGVIVETRYNPIVQAIHGLEKPVIAAINGVAAGAGATIALACDIVLASEKASFILSFINVGLIPDSGGTFSLPRLIGPQQAKAMAMLGEKLSAERAHSLGIVYKTFPEDNFQNEVKSVAKKLVALPVLGLSLTKRAINSSFENSFESQLKLEKELQHRAGNSSDYKEGLSAFLEKRPPKFSGA